MYEVSRIKKVTVYDKLRNFKLFKNINNGITFKVKLIEGFKGCFSYEYNILGGIKTRQGYIGLRFNSSLFCNKELVDIFVIYNNKHTQSEKSRYLCSVQPNSEFEVNIKRERGNHRFVVRTNSNYKSLVLRVNSYESFRSWFYCMYPSIDSTTKVKFQFKIKRWK